MILNKANNDFCTITLDFLSSRFHHILEWSDNAVQDGTNEVFLCISGVNQYISIVEDSGNLGNFVLKVKSVQNGTPTDWITDVPYIYGQENIIRFEEIYNDSTKFTGRIDNISQDSSYTLVALYGILDNAKVIFGASDFTTPVGVTDNTIPWIKASNQIITHDFDLTQAILNPLDDYYVSDKGVKAIVTTTDISALRGDTNSATTHPVEFTFAGMAQLKENVNFDVTGVAGTPFTSDAEGKLTLNLPVGTYNYTASIADFDDLISTVDVEADKKKEFIALSLTNNSVFRRKLNESILGDDLTQPHLLGNFLEAPDGSTRFYDGDALIPLDEISGNSLKYFDSIAHLKLKSKSKLNQLVETASYYGDGNVDTNYNFNGGGGRYQCISIDPVTDGYVDDGLDKSIVFTNQGDVFKLIPNKENIADVKQHGAIGTYKWAQQKNPWASDVSGFPDSTSAIRSAISYLNKNTESYSNTPSGILYFDGHFVIQDQADVRGELGEAIFNIQRGVSVWMEGISSVHSYCDAPLFRLYNAYRTVNRANVYYKMFGGVTGGKSWWIRNGQTEPDNKYSIGFEIVTGRKNTTYIEAYAFGIGFSLHGKGEGVVENNTYLGDIRDCRYGIVARADFSGWSTQNNFIGGRIKLDATGNRDYAIPIPDYFGLTLAESSAIWIEGDTYYTEGINLEGNGAYEKVLFERGGGFSVHNVLRLEGSSKFKGSIDIPQTSILVNGYHSNKAHLTDVGVVEGGGSIPAGIDALIWEGNKGTYFGDGSLHLNGSQSDDQSHLGATVTVKSNVSTGINSVFKHMIGNQIKSRITERGNWTIHTDNAGNPIYLDIEKELKRIGRYSLAVWAADTWYTYGTFFEDGGNKYWATDAFKSGSISLLDDVANSALSVELQTVTAVPIEFRERLIKSPLGFVGNKETLDGLDYESDVALMPMGVQLTGEVSLTDAEKTSTQFDLHSGILRFLNTTILSKAETFTFNTGKLAISGIAVAETYPDNEPTVTGAIKIAGDEFIPDSGWLVYAQYNGQNVQYWLKRLGSFNPYVSNDFSVNVDHIERWNGGAGTIVVDAGKCKVTGVGTRPQFAIVPETIGWTPNTVHRIKYTLDSHDSTVIDPIFTIYGRYNEALQTIDTSITPLPVDVEFISREYTFQNLLKNTCRMTTGDIDSSIWIDNLVVEEISAELPNSFTNEEGTVIDLGQKDGGTLNFTTPSVATTYTLLNITEAGGWRECFIDTTGMTAWTDITVTGSTIATNNVAFVAATMFRMVVRNIDGTTIEHKFLER